MVEETIRYRDGVYVGEVKNGIEHGKGTFTLDDGEKYDGEWIQGRRSGRGTMTFSNGDKYEGEYKDGKRDGRGTYTYPDGSKYEGEWKDDEIWNGTYYGKDGTTSEYKDGKVI